VEIHSEADCFKQQEFYQRMLRVSWHYSQAIVCFVTFISVFVVTTQKFAGCACLFCQLN
jgi:hypothetical protein